MFRYFFFNPSSLVILSTVKVNCSVKKSGPIFPIVLKWQLMLSLYRVHKYNFVPEQLKSKHHSVDRSSPRNFTHRFNKYLRSTKYVPETILRAKNTTMSKTRFDPCPRLAFGLIREASIKQISREKTM